MKIYRGIAMNQMLHIGFKGKNNASCILVKSISTDSYLLTNSFEGLKRDIENLDYSYDCVILFGIDKNLVNAVRIEKAAEKETKEYSLLILKFMVNLDYLFRSSYMSV